MSAYTEIAKYDTYNDRMAKSMLDKLFFLDKVGDAQVFVDFGCADGTLFKYMRPFLPDAIFIGFDVDQQMCRHARSNCVDSKTEFHSRWDDVVSSVRLLQTADEAADNKKVCLILSSVIHEVYHYGDVQTIDRFWKDVFTVGFEYIALRDMIPSESVDRDADLNDVAKVLRDYRDTKELKDFERRWGSIKGNKNLLHFLLKYKYVTPNWEREVKENYLPIYWEDFMALLPREYDIMYHEHGILPYTKRAIRDDLGIELKDATHLKLVLEKKCL